MHMRIIWTALIVAWIPCLAIAETDFKPFTIDWSKAAESVIDLSTCLEAPAGKGGFIQVKGEHLVKPDGSRFRIWGVNMCGPECFPDKQAAPLIAADLARMGVNCVRFHHLDSNWGRSVFDGKRDDTRHLDAENLDRLDFFIAELKKKGIYTNLNLNVLRNFKAQDGVRDYRILGIGKSATYFNARLIELQHEYARQLLTHRNAYTGNEYRHEPAVVTVEMVNENSLLEGWAGWRLVGRDDKAGDTWSPIPVSYAEELTDQFNQWLEKNVSPSQLDAIRKEAGAGSNGRVPRLMPNQFAKASKERFHAEAGFYMEVEKRFFEGMKRLLKDELGVKAPLVGTADHNDSISGYPHISANLVFDIVDGHGYWEHPHLGKETWIKNTPMVNDPLDSTVTQFARTPVLGRPYTISETNHPFPHQYACEGFPILTAYALLHDWDGIYWFNYGAGRLTDGKRGMGYWFDFSNDPVKVTNLYACALMWYRRDVRMAERLIVRPYSRQQIIETLRMDRDKERPFFTPGFARSTPLQSRTRFTLDGSPSGEFPVPAQGAIESDTNELGWYRADRKRGLVSIDTPCTQGLIGFVKGSGKATRYLSADVRNEFCSLMLTSLDGRPLNQSARILLAATAQVANSGMRWKEDRQTLIEWGGLPVLIEPVVGTVTLRDLGSLKSLRVWSLTPEGRIQEPETAGRQTTEGWQIQLGVPATTWYLLEPLR